MKKNKTLLILVLLALGILLAVFLSKPAPLFRPAIKTPDQIDVVAKMTFLHHVEVRGASIIERANSDKKSFQDKTFYLDIEPLITPEDFINIRFDSSDPARLRLNIELSSIGQKIFQNYASQFPDKHLVFIANNEILASLVVNTVALETTKLPYDISVPADNATFVNDLYKRIDTNL